MKNSKINSINKLSLPTLYGLLFMCVGMLVGGFVSSSAISHDYSYFFIYASLSGFLTAKYLAKLFIRRNSTFLSYANVSIFVGLLSHWLCWYFAAIEANIRYWILDEYALSPPLNLLYGMYGALVLCLPSWIFAGWATVLGSVICLLIAYRIKS